MLGLQAFYRFLDLGLTLSIHPSRGDIPHWKHVLDELSQHVAPVQDVQHLAAGLEVDFSWYGLLLLGT